jgi:B9 domain-containing protein 1
MVTTFWEEMWLEDMVLLKYLLYQVSKYCLISYTEYIPLFAPVATTPFYSVWGWIVGRLPEFLDSKFASKEQGRESSSLYLSSD